MTPGRRQFDRSPASSRTVLRLATAASLTLLLAACTTAPAPPPPAPAPPPAPVAPPPPPPPTLTEIPSNPQPAARTAVVDTVFTVGGTALPPMRGQQIVETRADMRRTDSLQGVEDRTTRALIASDLSTTIVRLDRRLIWTIDGVRKAYVECPLAGCGTSAAAPAARASASASCPVTVRKSSFKAAPTGERKTINTYSSERYLVTWAVELVDRQGGSSRHSVALDLWTTPETGAVRESLQVDRAFSKRWAGAVSAHDQPFTRFVPREIVDTMGVLMNRMATSPQAMAGINKEFDKVKGYPVTTSLTWHAHGSVCGDDVKSPAAAGGSPASGAPLLSYAREVKSITLRPVSDTWFQPAADHRKVQP